MLGKKVSNHMTTILWYELREPVAIAVGDAFSYEVNEFVEERVWEVVGMINENVTHIANWIEDETSRK